MSMRITITKQFNEKELTTKKGCFNCTRYITKKCMLSENGMPLKVDEIRDNGKGKKFRAGCCCVDYKPYKEQVQFT